MAPAARTEAESAKTSADLPPPPIVKEEAESKTSRPQTGLPDDGASEKECGRSNGEDGNVAEGKKVMTEEKEASQDEIKQTATDLESSSKPVDDDGQKGDNDRGKLKGQTDGEKDDPADSTDSNNAREVVKPESCEKLEGESLRREDAEPGDRREAEGSPSPHLRSGSASPRRHSAGGGGDRDDESVGAESLELHDEEFEDTHVRNAESDDEDNEATNPEKLATAEPLISAPQDKMRMLRSTVRRLVRDRKDLRAQLRRVRSALDSELRDLALRSGIKLPPRGSVVHEGDGAKDEKEGAEPPAEGHEADDVTPQQQQGSDKEGEAAQLDESPPESSGAKRRRASEGDGNEETKLLGTEGVTEQEAGGQEDGSAAMEATSEPQRKKPRLVEIDPSQRRRSRNLFGRLMGHLQKAKETLEKEKDSRQNELQQAASQRITEKLAKDKEHLRAAKLKELMTANETLRSQLRKLNWEIEVAETQHLRYQLEGHYTHMQNFISTRAQPTIFWTPNTHTAATKALQSQMSHDIEIKISKIAQQTKPPTFDEFCAHQDQEKALLIATYEDYRRQLREKLAASGQELPGNLAGINVVLARDSYTGRLSQSGPGQPRYYRNPDIEDEADVDHEFDDGADHRTSVVATPAGISDMAPHGGRAFGSGGGSTGRAPPNNYNRGGVRGGPEFGNGRRQRSFEGSGFRPVQSTEEMAEEGRRELAGFSTGVPSRLRNSYYGSGGASNFQTRSDSRGKQMGHSSGDHHSARGGALMSEEQSELKSRRSRNYSRDDDCDRDDSHSRRLGDSGRQRGGLHDDRRSGFKVRGDTGDDGDERTRSRSARDLSPRTRSRRRQHSPSPSPKRRRPNADDERRPRVSSRQRSPSPGSKNTW